MGLLGVDQSEFDKFRADVNKQITSLTAKLESRSKELENAIALKATDSEDIAKTAAAAAVSHQTEAQQLVNAIAQALTEIGTYKDAASQESLLISEIKSNLLVSTKELDDSISLLNTQYDLVDKDKLVFDKSIKDVQDKIALLDAVLAKKDSLDTRAASIVDLSEKSAALHKELVSLHDNAVKRRGLIDDVYFEIFGREVKSANGSVQKEEGLKDELDKTYNELSEKLGLLSENSEEVINLVYKEYQNELAIQQEKFELLVNNSKERVESADSELRALMPGGMAAGLSAAYEAKAKEEVLAQNKYAESFQYAIFAMIAISSIPFIVDAYLLIGRQLDILDVIRGTPNLIFSILPLYFPVLWFAYSVNKKLNLSKRLIEEYTHKAVLGKTFSGLSGQIESLPHEDAVKGELKTRLLYNLLQVSAENPGKLITDYNTSDHPLMDALEKSTKLSDAADALAKLPGFGALAEKLAARSRNISDVQNQKVVAGLEVQEDMKS